MINTNLILLEGLPSTGKTTNSRFIHTQLDLSRISAQWIHEIATPHPLLLFDEAGFTHDEYTRFIKSHPEAAGLLNHFAVFRKSTVGIGLPEIQWCYRNHFSERVYQALLEFDAWNFSLELYKKFALEKWAHFAEKAMENRGEVFIVDSVIFQFQIFSFLLKNKPYEEMQSFIDQIIGIIQPLNPCLIFLYRESAEATIEYLENDRGTSYLEYLWQRDKAQPYYQGRPPGAEGFKQFLRDYAVMADLLFAAFPAQKRSVEISGGNWAFHEDEMLSFLDVHRLPIPNVPPQDGVYTNKALNLVIRVHGMSITDPNGDTRKLFPKAHNEFYVDWLPTILRFEEGRILISGLQTGSRWTATGMVYTRSAETP